eukprot:GHVU01224453.1.p1 GENE.GHVU01224453.1~~GHVU01224453.1.p1  ORF type:complete len:118 (+),score=12.04 GHVU01224453.1:331-684(+)
MNERKHDEMNEGRGPSRFNDESFTNGLFARMLPCAHMCMCTHHVWCDPIDDAYIHAYADVQEAVRDRCDSGAHVAATRRVGGSRARLHHRHHEEGHHPGNNHLPSVLPSFSDVYMNN